MCNKKFCKTQIIFYKLFPEIHQMIIEKKINKYWKKIFNKILKIVQESCPNMNSKQNWILIRYQWQNSLIFYTSVHSFKVLKFYRMWIKILKWKKLNLNYLTKLWAPVRQMFLAFFLQILINLFKFFIHNLNFVDLLEFIKSPFINIDCLYIWTTFREFFVVRKRRESLYKNSNF